MKWLGPLLLLGVFIRHDTSQWLPWLTPAEWFYVLGGLLEVLLCLALLVFLRQPLAVLALCVGIVEGTETAVCGAVLGHERAPPGVNECDYLIGWPLGAWQTGIFLIASAVAVAFSWKRL